MKQERIVLPQNRLLKRVPLDFDWSLGKVWNGYYVNYCTANHEGKLGDCGDCKKFAKLKGLPYHDGNCPDFELLNGPPKGDGYQLWEITSEGAPISPVFENLDMLCAWCESHASIYDSLKITKEQWKDILSEQEKR